MEVKIIAYTPEPEKVVAAAAKLCYSNKATIDDLMDDLTPENTEKFLEHIIEVGHSSTLEHASFTFAIEGVSRALLAEASRHRIGCSYSVRSQRYCNEEGCSYTTPETLKDTTENTAYNLNNLYKNALAHAESTYKALIEQGVPKEDARMVLPNATHTRMIITMNVRSLRHFFNLRCCSRAQAEIRSLANEMLRKCKEISPILFKNAGASCVELGYCPEGNRCCGRAKTLKELINK